MNEEEFKTWIAKSDPKRPIPTSVLQAAISSHGFYRVAGLLRKFEAQKKREAGELRSKARRADAEAKRMFMARDWVEEAGKAPDKNSPRYNQGPRSRG